MESSGPFDFDAAHRAARPTRPPPREQPRRRRGSETIARILWVLPWIAFVIAIIVVGGPLFAAAMIAFACVGMAELFRVAPGGEAFIPGAFAVASGMIAAALYGTHFQIVIAFACLFPLMFFAAALRAERANFTVGAAITVFAVAWIAIPFTHAVLLRELPDHGAGLLVDVLIATFVADTAAYAGGRMFGRHRLAPSLSPNKTVEGLAFGFLGGAMGFWFAGLYQDWLTGIDALLLGIAVAAAAPIGDLFESLVKRDLGVKDTGNIFGPHGGMLDRIDAVLFTVPVGYYLAIALL